MNCRLNRLLISVTALSLLIVLGFLLPLFASEDIFAAVKGSNAYLKSRPGPKADTILIIESDEVVLIKNRLEEPDKVSGVSDRWYFVQYKGLSGWIFGTSLDMNGSNLKKSYIENKLYFERINEMYEEKEAGNLKKAVVLANEIVSDVELNFSMDEILSSKRLNEIVLDSLTIKGECLVFLKKFEDAKETYDYLLKNYSNARLEQDPISASEIIGPYLVYMKHFSKAIVFPNAEKGLERLKEGLDKKDLLAISDLAIAGIFEVWVANTDWVIKLGEMKLINISWLSEHWADDWKVISIDPKIGADDKIVGYCIKTGPWNINYSGRPVESIDFCIDTLPGGSVVFGYLVLYTEPVSD